MSNPNNNKYSVNTNYSEGQNRNLRRTNRASSLLLSMFLLAGSAGLCSWASEILKPSEPNIISSGQENKTYVTVGKYYDSSTRGRYSVPNLEHFLIPDTISDSFPSFDSKVFQKDLVLKEVFDPENGTCMQFVNPDNGEVILSIFDKNEIKKVKESYYRNFDEDYENVPHLIVKDPNTGKSDGIYCITPVFTHDGLDELNKMAKLHSYVGKDLKGMCVYPIDTNAKESSTKFTNGERITDQNVIITSSVAGSLIASVDPYIKRIDILDYLKSFHDEESGKYTYGNLIDVIIFEREKNPQVVVMTEATKRVFIIEEVGEDALNNKDYRYYILYPDQINETVELPDEIILE